jgi:predicted TPR repeat methyltransferase
MTTNSNPSHISSEEFTKLFNHACSLQENGDLSEALQIYDHLLNFLPDSHLLHFNCGLAHFDLQNFSKAESHYSKALADAADDPDIYYNRGLNFRRLQRYEDAAISFEAAFETGDPSVDTLYNLALCHQDLGDDIEAGRLYNSILSQDPKHQSSINNFAYLCHKTGDTKRAASLYAQLLKLNPEHQAAQHMLSSITGTTPDTAPLEYVESIFDNYADDFEHSLIENLRYRTPEVLYDFLCKSINNRLHKKCLDLGCGTGLAGEQFRQCCDELTGIDISQKMLAIADKKNLYDKLFKDDIIHFLQKSDQKCNLILAADVFTYMGDLEKIFTECGNSIAPSGILLFSVEEALNSQKGFELKPTGRFGHSADYIEKLSKKTRWTMISHKLSKLRKEKGKWIMGHLYILQQ